MKQMLIAVLVIVAYAGCKKHDTTPSVPSRYYFEYTINGKTVRYTNNTGAIRQYPVEIFAYGYEHFGMNANGIKLQIDYLNGPAVIPGTYTDTANKAGGSNNPWDVRAYLQQGGTSYVTSKAWNVTSGNHFRTTITTITADSITGTFSGRVYWGAAANYLDVSNGKFCANF